MWFPLIKKGQNIWGYFKTCRLNHYFCIIFHRIFLQCNRMLWELMIMPFSFQNIKKKNFEMEIIKLENMTYSFNGLISDDKQPHHSAVSTVRFLNWHKKRTRLQWTMTSFPDATSFVGRHLIFGVTVFNLMRCEEKTNNRTASTRKLHRYVVFVLDYVPIYSVIVECSDKYSTRKNFLPSTCDFSC